MKMDSTPDMFPPRGHPAKRQSILNAAAAVFCREGFSGANIDLVAAEAGVSRQTVYNHHGDKEKLLIAVVRDITERINARAFAVLDTFPDHPKDLKAELTAFALRFNWNCIACREGKFLQKLIQNEAERYPELFAAWRKDGPGKIRSSLAARFARLAHAGYLQIDDPDLAARQFLALVNADLQIPALFGETLSEKDMAQSASKAVCTFLRAYGKNDAEDSARALEGTHQA